MDGDSARRTLETALRHCNSAEQAAGAGRWEQAAADVAAVHATVRDLAQNRGPGGTGQEAAAALRTLNERLRALGARVTAARETTAATLCGLRKQRHAADTYRQHE